MFSSNMLINISSTLLLCKYYFGTYRSVHVTRNRVNTIALEFNYKVFIDTANTNVVTVQLSCLKFEQEQNK